MSMTEAELKALAEANAKALGLNLPEGAAAQIGEQLGILLEHAANFVEFDLPPEAEPLTEFTP